MKEDIISQKLKRELTNLPINTEARVMYLLVEIRKVLEHDGNNKDNLLSFYGDWVVHTNLSRKFANKVFEEIKDENSVIGNHIKSFNLLKNELLNFFVYHRLPDDLIKKHWVEFRDKLLDILIDTPIMNETKNMSFGFHKTDTIGGIQYYLKEGKNFHTLGRIMVD